MKKMILLVAVFFLLVVPALGALLEVQEDRFGGIAANRYAQRRYGDDGVKRVTHFDPRVNKESINAWVYLEPVEAFDFPGSGRGGYVPMFPRASARFKTSIWNGNPSSFVVISTKDLPTSWEQRSQFEAWLVDDETGYRLSMGTFATAKFGSAELRYRVDNLLTPYDRIEITSEPFNDMDVLPGPVMLTGRIAKRDSYYPQASPKRLRSNNGFKTI